MSFSDYAIVSTMFLSCPTPKKVKVGYITAFPPIILSQPPLEVVQAKNTQKAESHLVCFMAEWTFEPGSPQPQSDTTLEWPLYTDHGM